jgi:DNA-binding HxlR family transcriptional regulator
LPKVLGERRQRDGTVERRAYAEMPPRVEYSLAPLALTLREPLASVQQWAEVDVHDIIAARTMRRRERRV